MVYLASSDSIDINNFELSWRLTDPKRCQITREQGSRLLTLSEQRSGEVFEQSTAFRVPTPPRLRDEAYQAVEGISLEGETDSDVDMVRSWLEELPIPSSEMVYVSWSPTIALVTDWEMLTQLWADLWYPFDTLNVFDDTLEWALLFGPEEFAVFAVKGAENRGINSRETDLGKRLIQAMPPSA